MHSNDVLRGLLLLAAAGGVIYIWLSRPSGTVVRYEAVPSIQGGRSFGMPLVGLAVDPSRRDVFAIVGGPKKPESEATFFIAWTGADGETYSTAFAIDREHPDALCQVKDGEVRTIHTFGPSKDGSAGVSSRQVATADTALPSVLGTIPTNGRH